ncbi:L-serine dehydratase [Spathaspora sp. JA1]|nr:L-serine dehydratase [Spathaspora sp. JA1]
MSQPSINTTLIEVTDKLTTPPCRIFFKNEYEQPSGSFKLRGMGHLISTSIITAKQLDEKKNVKVFSSSGGNAGLAAAYSAKYYNVPCIVVLPETSKINVIEKLQSFDAKVIIHGKHWGEADSYLKNMINELDDSIYPVYCHPFDNELLWQGHGNFIDELTQQLSPSDLKKVKGVVCSVGGGGLYNGVVEGLNRNPRLSNVPILAIETKQAPTFNEAIKQGKVIHLQQVNTLATSLASPYISEKSLTNYSKHKTNVVEIDDLDAIKGVIDMYDTFEKMVEPACGASVCVAFNRQDLLEVFDVKNDDIVIVIACGGSGVTKEILQQYRDLAN